MMQLPVLYLVGLLTATGVVLVLGFHAIRLAVMVYRLRHEIQSATRLARQRRRLSEAEAIPYDVLAQRARHGDHAAQTRMGLLYATGSGVHRDERRGVTFFRKAAEAGFRDAQYYLALAYDTGRGVPPNFSLATYWYEQAARSGQELAQCNLGATYLHKPDATALEWLSAVKWLLMASFQDVPEASNLLEWVIRNQEDAPNGMTAAISQLSARASRGDRDAMFVLGWCYERGFWIKPDRDAALEWYERASAKQHLAARVARAQLLKVGDPSGPVLESDR